MKAKQEKELSGFNSEQETSQAFSATTNSILANWKLTILLPAVVGGVVLIAIIVAVVVVVYRRRAQQQQPVKN